jgi:hypothetical protein
MDWPGYIFHLWSKGAHFRALRQAWGLGDWYRLDLVEQGAMDLRALLVAGCRQAVATAGRRAKQASAAWLRRRLEAWDRGPAPASLTVARDGPDCQTHRAEMIRVHFLCTLAAIDNGPEGGRALAGSLGLPAGFVLDLVRVLRGELPRAALDSQPVLPLLVDEAGGGQGFVGRLTLEYIPDGDGSLYPDPGLAFVHRAESFRAAEEDARQAAFGALGLDGRANFDLRWSLQAQLRPRPGELTGNSAGLAFALDILQLAGRHVGRPKS